jgi:hypothetical protein
MNNSNTVSFQSCDSNRQGDCSTDSDATVCFTVQETDLVEWFAPCPDCDGTGWIDGVVGDGFGCDTCCKRGVVPAAKA